MYVQLTVIVYARTSLDRCRRFICARYLHAVRKRGSVEKSKRCVSANGRSRPSRAYTSVLPTPPPPSSHYICPSRALVLSSRPRSRCVCNVIIILRPVREAIVVSQRNLKPYTKLALTHIPARYLPACVRAVYEYITIVTRRLNQNVCGLRSTFGVRTLSVPVLSVKNQKKKTVQIVTYPLAVPFPQVPASRSPGGIRRLVDLPS